MYKGLTTTVVTNIGTFGSFKDLEKCMRFDGHSKVNIIGITLYGSPSNFNSLGGNYTYDEIKQVVNN